MQRLRDATAARSPFALAGLSPLVTITGSLVLGLEDTGSRMSRLGKGELLHPDLLSVDEILARVDRVTDAEVASIAAELLNGNPSLAVIGPFDDRDFSSSVA